MQERKGIVLAITAIAVCGGMSIYTLPFRNTTQMPDSGLTTEQCTLDEQIERCEQKTIQNRAYLDGLLEHAELEAQSLEMVMEARDIVTDITETETETESITEQETTDEESISEPVEIFDPVDSMMAADLQAWVYAASMEKGLDPYIIMAICERESCCTANIMGDGGRAFGMMQIHTVWVRDKMAAHGYTDAEMLQAVPNITIGMEILSDYLATDRGIEWALMAYNGGPGNAGNATTQQYANWVLTRANELRR